MIGRPDRQRQRGSRGHNWRCEVVESWWLGALQEVQRGLVRRIAKLCAKQGQPQRVATVDQDATIIESHKVAACHATQAADLISRRDLSRHEPRRTARAHFQGRRRSPEAALNARRCSPEDRVAGPCLLPDEQSFPFPGDTPARRREFAARMERRRAQEAGADYEASRRDWILGSEAFRRELLAAVAGQVGPSHYGAQRQETAVEKAERLLKDELGDWAGGRGDSL